MCYEGLVQYIVEKHIVLTAEFMVRRLYYCSGFVSEVLLFLVHYFHRVLYSLCCARVYLCAWVLGVEQISYFKTDYLLFAMNKYLFHRKK